MEPGREKPTSHVMKRETALAGLAGLLLMTAGGGALIVWWAVAFHRSNDELWMVPVGLVLLGTPVIAWVSVLASSACQRPEILLTAASHTGNSDASPDPER